MTSQSRPNMKPTSRVGISKLVNLIALPSSAIAMPLLVHVAILLTAATFATPAAEAQTFRERLKDRIKAQPGLQAIATSTKTKSLREERIAGLRVAFWVPRKTSGPWPVVLFSHGLHGINRQSEYLSEALADAGYLVLAPNHADAIGSANGSKAEYKLAHPGTRSENSYRSRGEDIAKIFAALKLDPQWNSRIDWSKVVLMGHSLGGYTALAMAGAWQSWKLPDATTVVALSPYTNPFVHKRTLQNIHIPVMYQTGTADFGVAPFLKAPDGAFKMTPAPAYLVDLVGANHFAWTNLNREKFKENLIEHYVISFLDRYVKGDTRADPGRKLPGVFELWQH